MEEKKKKKKSWVLLLLLLLLFLIGGFLFLIFKKTPNFFNGSNFLTLDDSLRRVSDSLAREDSLLRVDDSIYLEDSLRRVEDSLKRISDSLIHADSVTRADSIQKFNDSVALIENEKRKKDSLQAIEIIQKKADSIARVEDSLKRISDSLALLEQCDDTIAPWIYPEPSGGLHYEPVEVSFIKSEPCSVFYRFSEEKEFRLWDKKTINLSIDENLFYYAIDSCGNSSEIKSKKYVFEKSSNDKSCPENMTYIENAENGFCIDKYEWPNKKGASPTSNVSFAEAADSCFIAGKRLCTSDEWRSACRGKYDWNYPYGTTYEEHACNTQEKRVSRSGKAGECRGWYSVYDMVGNLAEWTSTPSSKDSRFYIVKGGFWESGKRANCDSERYSYYPQNKHNPVGFRCCKDAGN